MSTPTKLTAAARISSSTDSQRFSVPLTPSVAPALNPTNAAVNSGARAKAHPTMNPIALRRPFSGVSGRRPLDAVGRMRPANPEARPRSAPQVRRGGVGPSWTGRHRRQCHEDWLPLRVGNHPSEGAIPRVVRVRARVTPLDVVSEADGLTSPHSSPNSRARSMAADLDDTPNFA